MLFWGSLGVLGDLVGLRFWVSEFSVPGLGSGFLGSGISGWVLGFRFWVFWCFGF